FNEVDGPYRAGFHIGFFDTLVGWKSAYNWSERLRAVTAADVQRAAKKYFNSDNRVIGWLTSPNAPKPAPPKSEPAAEPAKPKEQKPPIRHHHMTGYKLDDNAVGPNKRANVLLAQVEPQASGAMPSAAAAT